MELVERFTNYNWDLDPTEKFEWSEEFSEADNRWQRQCILKDNIPSIIFVVDSFTNGDGKSIANSTVSDLLALSSTTLAQNVPKMSPVSWHYNFEMKWKFGARPITCATHKSTLCKPAGPLMWSIKSAFQTAGDGYPMSKEEETATIVTHETAVGYSRSYSIVLRAILANSPQSLTKCQWQTRNEWIHSNT